MTEPQQVFWAFFTFWTIIGLAYPIATSRYKYPNNRQKLFVSFFCGPLAFLVQICICIYEWLGD